MDPWDPADRFHWSHSSRSGEEVWADEYGAAGESSAERQVSSRKGRVRAPSLARVLVFFGNVGGSVKVAILGTRGIPANYGGFETFAQELSCRLARRGHDVTVYCRSRHTPRGLRSYGDVRLVTLPTIRHKYLDTVFHTFLSALHAMIQGYDAALVCNAANALFLPMLKRSGARVAINVDGLEWKRKKWNRFAKRYYRLSEKLACRLTDALVTDSKTIQRYYRETYGCESTFIPYGAPLERATTERILGRFGIEWRKYLLYVSRFEPENNAHRVLDSFRSVPGKMPLVMVGAAPYARKYIARLKAMADDRVIFTGAVYGEGYRELVSGSYCCVHATEVGGTHPALLEAMAMGNGALVSDTPENREVAGEGALFFSLSNPHSLSDQIRFALSNPRTLAALADKGREKVNAFYRWDLVTDAYETVFRSPRVDGAAAATGGSHPYDEPDIRSIESSAGQAVVRQMRADISADPSE